MVFNSSFIQLVSKIKRDDHEFNKQETTIKNINNNFHQENKRKNPDSYSVIELKLLLLCETNQIPHDQNKVGMENKNWMQSKSIIAMRAWQPALVNRVRLFSEFIFFIIQIRIHSDVWRSKLLYA